MKTLFIAALLLSAPLAHAENWSDADTYREATYLTLHAADWAQTRWILRHKEQGFYEANPMVGKHPHSDKLDEIAVATAFAHVYVASVLPKGFRKNFQYFSIGVKAGLIAHNFQLGIKAKF